MSAPRVVLARLSGMDFYGVIAEKMYTIAALAAFDEITTSRHAHVTRGSKALLSGFAQPSGVSGYFELAFDTLDELNEWAATAKVADTSEAEASELYRALLDAMKQQVAA
jgi:hypothetical protein